MRVWQHENTSKSHETQQYSKICPGFHSSKKARLHTRVWGSSATFSGLFKRHLNPSSSSECRREDKARPPRFVRLLLPSTLMFNTDMRIFSQLPQYEPPSPKPTPLVLICGVHRERDGRCKLLGIPNKHAVNTSSENLVWQQLHAARISSERMNPVPGYLCV